MIEKEIVIYIGSDEWEAWKKVSIKNDCPLAELPPIMPEENGDGITYLAFIWLYSKDNINTIFHELQHAKSAIFKYLGCEDEEEMKAYICGYVDNEVYKWI